MLFICHNAVKILDFKYLSLKKTFRVEFSLNYPNTSLLVSTGPIRPFYANPKFGNNFGGFVCHRKHVTKNNVTYMGTGVFR